METRKKLFDQNLLLELKYFLRLYLQYFATGVLWTKIVGKNELKKKYENLTQENEKWSQSLSMFFPTQIFLLLSKHILWYPKTFLSMPAFSLGPDSK